jgi:hypothetical protein
MKLLPWLEVGYVLPSDESFDSKRARESLEHRFVETLERDLDKAEWARKLVKVSR